MDYEGKIYRPWMEANSLLIQTTIGCTHNQCTFCDMFREKKFRVKPVEQVVADIEEARKYYRQVDEIFLIDGNVLALKTEKLLPILEKVKATFPECSRISLYAGYNDLRRKSVEELKQLKAVGLDMAYVGLESGDVQTLENIKKGMTPEEAIEGAANAKAAGIRVLASFIFGIGGRDRSKEHIKATVDLLNIIQPEEIAPMALAIQPGTELEQEMERGEFVMPTRRQVLEEEKYLLENLNDFDSFYWGDHGNNIVPLKGRLPHARQMFLKKVDAAIRQHSETHEEILETFSW
ncbi:radical SAM protein [Pontiellaceae bacterium B12227]|nr:radical SAM protein [Pontiellaceae bacterium B12227]